MSNRLPLIGAWVGSFGLEPSDDTRAAARELEWLGYGALWVAEALGKEVFTNAAIVLSATGRIVVGTGIANLWVRDATAMANAANTLAEAFPGRFLLGIGVSHRPLVERRGHVYESPLAALEHYIDAMDANKYRGPAPDRPPLRLLGALGPRMLRLAGARLDGALPYLGSAAHTRTAREQLGPGGLLAPAVAVLVSTDPEAALDLARRHLGGYIGLPNYRQHFLRQGFTDDDLEDGGSERFVDAVVAMGDVPAVVGRIKEHLEAGADHVAINPLGNDLQALLAQFRTLAPALAEIDPDWGARAEGVRSPGRR
jgi:probable F420-dependent oxidoreductase